VNDTGPQEPPHEEAAPKGRGAGGEGPGRRLREAREAQRLSRADAARQLHLDSRMVTALEEDDHDRLPAPIYVSGYLRSYARLLNLPEDEIVAAYDGGDEEPSLVPNIDLKPQTRRTDMVVRLVTYLVVLVLLVLLGLWWFGVGSQRRATLPSEATAPAISQSAPNVSAAVPGVAPPDTAPTVSSVAPPSGTGAQGSGRQGAPPSTSPAPTAAVQTPGGESGSDRAAAGGGSGSRSPAAAILGPQQHLTLHYSDDSWTEVYDATGRQLVYRLIKAGETVELTGQAPFDVVLGYAPAVTIKYNGQPFDTGHVNSKDVGHFVVGKRGASAPAATSGGEGR